LVIFHFSFSIFICRSVISYCVEAVPLRGSVWLGQMTNEKWKMTNDKCLFLTTAPAYCPCS
jgi:hypothetical protein